MAALQALGRSFVVLEVAGLRRRRRQRLLVLAQLSRRDVDAQHFDRSPEVLEVEDRSLFRSFGGLGRGRLLQDVEERGGQGGLAHR